MKDHTRAPICEAIAKYHESGMLPFSVPGHKCGAGIDEFTKEHLGLATFFNDIPLAGGLDDRKTSHEIREEAEALAADAYGAKTCFFSVNGTSLSNHAALVAVADPGEAIVLPRNAHKSVIDAAIFAGCQIVFVEPEIDPEHGIEYGILPESLAEVLTHHPNAKAAFIVNPSYYGTSADVKAIADVCHKFGIPLVVDEAWGPHFPFHSEMPPSGIEAGADICVGSIHKTMNGLEQASIILAQGKLVDMERLEATVRMFESTTPSSLVMASTDAARRLMMLEGEKRWSQALLLARRLRDEAAKLPGLMPIGPERIGRPSVLAVDETKVLIDVSGLNITGYAAADWLYYEKKLAVELGDEKRLLFIVSLGDTPQTIDRAIAALNGLVKNARSIKSQSVELPDVKTLRSEIVMLPREAYFPPYKHVSLRESIGQIAAELITPYPPGVPRLIPGQLITKEIVDYLEEGLKAGMHIEDACDPKLKKIKIADVKKPRRTIFDL